MISSIRLLLVAVTIALVAASSNVAAAQEETIISRSPDENERSHHARRRERWTLIVGGSATLGAGWIVNAVASSAAGLYAVASFPGDVFGDWRLAPEWREVREFGWIPLAGPWMQLAASPVPWDQDAWAVWWVACGLVQAAGLAALLSGIGLSTKTDAIGSSSDIAFTLLPHGSPDTAGLSMIGSF